MRNGCSPCFPVCSKAPGHTGFWAPPPAVMTSKVDTFWYSGCLKWRYHQILNFNRIFHYISLYIWVKLHCFTNLINLKILWGMISLLINHDSSEVAVSEVVINYRDVCSEKSHQSTVIDFMSWYIYHLHSSNHTLPALLQASLQRYLSIRARFSWAAPKSFSFW